MPELQEDDTALGVDGIDQLAPAFDLPVRIEPGTPGLPNPVDVTGEASAMISPLWVARWA